MKQVVILGGDARMQAAADAFRQIGWNTRCGWMENEPKPNAQQLRNWLQGARAVVLPIPAFDAAGRLNTSCDGAAPDWKAIRAALPQGALLCGGRLPAVPEVETLDFCQSGTFAAANAVPAALAARGRFMIRSDAYR